MADTVDSQHNSESESKQRRLVPQFSLNNRQDVKPSHHEAPKKTVIRFTREQLISLRKSSSVLPSMKVMTEVTSLESQEPVCFSKLEPEDVIRIWNAATKDVGNRGRGRGRGNRAEDGNDDENQGGPNNDLWDDGGLLGSSEGKDFDLSEISKASLQFRSDMENMKLSNDVEISVKEIDAVESLIDQALAEASQQKEESLQSKLVSSLPVAATSIAVTRREESLPALSVPTFGVTSQPISGIDLDIPIEKSILPETNNFLKSVIGENVSGFLSSSTSSLLAPSFPVNSLFPTEPQLFTPPVEPEWFYTDPQQQVQGPFSQENMRLWNEAGYFAKDLPIKLRHWKNFHLFKDVFPEGRLSFYTVPSEPIRPQFPPSSALTFMLDRNLSVIPDNSRRIEFERPLVHEKPSLILGNNQLARSIVPNPEPVRNSVADEPLKFDSSLQSSRGSNLAVSNAKVVEKPKLEAAVATPTTATAADQTKSNDKSDYAKQILGISRKGRDISQPESSLASAKLEKAAVETPLIPSNEETAKNEQKSLDLKPKMGWKTAEANVPKPVSFLEVQQEAVDEQKVLKDKTTPGTPATVAANSTSTPAAMSVQLKSLLGLKPSTTSAPSPAVPAGKTKSAWSSTQVEVQSVPLTEIMKEEINQMKQKKDDGEKPRGTSWAAKIGSKPESTSLAVPSVATVAAPALSAKSAHTLAGPVSAPVERNPAPSNARPQQKTNDRSDFGGRKMSKELADWCASQLKVIKGIEDLTLMEFCMSLNSAVEIRETLASYLGSSPQVTNFATEFIKYKDEGKLPSSKTSTVDASISTANSNAKKKKGGK